jgi:hypothetical protein
VHWNDRRVTERTLASVREVADVLDRELQVDLSGIPELDMALEQLLASSLDHHA